MTERERIARIRAIFGERAPGIELGVGDDAAVLDAGSRKLVFSIDEQIEGTHFRRDLLETEDIGHRAFTAAASDLAAMGAEPYCALVALALPRELDDASFEAILVGVRAASQETRCIVVGGNLTRGPVIGVTTAVLGRAERPMTRAGAKVGDGVWVCGALGEAAAGFRALSRGIAIAPSIIAAWRRPRARLAEGMTARAIASAAVDVSDGLARDAGHIAEASNVAIALDRGALERRMSSELRAASEDPMALVLGGGEDYALLCTSASPIDGFDRIGSVIAGSGVTIDGAPIDVGFDHFE